MEKGKLVIVPTPIGNLGDMTMRAREALAQADIIFAEDTRVCTKLLRAFDIKNHVERLDEFSTQSKSSEILNRLEAAEVIAYCSDAGMPGVSDPGMPLVTLARDAGYDVEVLPGASAATTAYVASGFANQNFYFGGFFPRKDGQRTALLQNLSNLDAALIFYESPHRIVDSLEAIAHIFPHRKVAVCREMTKLHEEVAAGPSQDIAAQFATRASEGAIKGEIAFVIEGSVPLEAQEQELSSVELARARALELLEQGSMRKKEIAATIAQEFNIPRNQAYEITLGK